MLKLIKIDSLPWFFKVTQSIIPIPYSLSSAAASRETTSWAQIHKKRYNDDKLGKARGTARNLLHEAAAMHELTLPTLRHGRVNKSRTHAGLTQKKLRKRNESVRLHPVDLRAPGLPTQPQVHPSKSHHDWRFFIPGKLQLYPWAFQ